MPINEWYFKFRNFLSRRLPKIYYFCNKRKAIIKFFISGAVAGTSDLILLFIFHGLLYWNIILSTSLAFILAFVVSFSLQKLWTFRNNDKKKTLRQFVLYFLTALINLNLNGFFMHILVNELGWWYLLSQLVINLLLGVINFLVYKFIIFKTKNETSCK